MQENDFSDRPYVVVIGGINMDVHGAPNSKLRMQDSNPGVVRMSAGGVARNVAENLARLDINSRLISVVGNDQNGEQLLQEGRSAGIDMQHVMKLNSFKTSTYMSVLDESGDMCVAISDMAIIDQLGPNQLQPLEKLFREAALIVIDTNLSDEALSWLASNIVGQAFFVDAVSTSKAKKIRPYLSAVHTLKPNIIEAESIASMNARTDDELSKLADWFHTQGVDRLFVTLGDRGVYYSTEESRGRIAASKIHSELCNTGGAGDAFLSGLVYAWLNQWDIHKTVGFAMAAASVTLNDQQTSNPGLSLSAVNQVYESSHAE